MGGENGLCLADRRWLPCFAQPPLIPFTGQLEHGLCRDRVTVLSPGALQPVCEIGLRPEAPDVRSGEPDVIPELARRHEEMDEAIRGDDTVAHLPQQPPLIVDLAVAEE